MRRKYREPDWPRLMTIEAACAYLGDVEREKFLAAIAPSLLPIKLPDGAVRYDRHDLDRWVDGRGVSKARRSDTEWLEGVSNA
jgi:hypothetical protein